MSLPQTIVQFNLQKGQYDAALKLLERCVGIQVSILGEGHPTAVRTQHATAQCLTGKGEPDASLEPCRGKQASSLGEEHPSFAAALLSAAQCRVHESNFEAALKLLERCKNIYASTLGEKHHVLASTLEHVSEELHAMQQSLCRQP